MIAGTSGAGKGTIGRALLERFPDLHWSVSAATRAPRPGEIDGRDYHFMSREEFEELRGAGGFLEWFEVYGDLKGTPRGPIEEWLAAGDDVLVEVDVQGALNIKESEPEATLVFIRAPSADEQRRRLEERTRSEGRQRGTDDGLDDEDRAVIERRLAEAEREEQQANRFDHIVTNANLDEAVDEVAGILEDLRGRS